MRACPKCRRSFIDVQDVCPLDNATLQPARGELPAGLGRDLGQYRLVCLLGEGGMGNIYIGRHVALGRYVAIKVLRKELASRKEAVARFFQEADTINRLRHPNIVDSIDLVEDAVDGAYCVLELLRGPDLNTRLVHGELPIDSVLQIGAQIADALGAVHAIGIVHRDLKPHNLILTERDGRDDLVKLIDFGAAQIGVQAAGAVGTAAYMAPEQAAGGQVDGRADLYSLGVILFEMATGRHPFPSKTDAEFLVRHASVAPPRPCQIAPRCPPSLEAVILRCLEKDPAKRPTDASTVAAWLRQIDPSSGRARGRGKWLVAGLFAAAATAAGVFFGVRYLNDEEGPRTSDIGPRTSDLGPRPAPAPAAPAPDLAEARSPKPEAPPEPKAPAIVDIDVVSTPAGAKAFRRGETIPLGTTPFTVQLPKSDKPVHVRFDLAGYESKDIEVPIAASMEIDVSLTKSPAKPAVVVVTKPPPVVVKEPEKPKTHKLQAEGVANPFEK